jgi:hypothetical protein
VGASMTCTHNKFHIPSSSGSLVIAIKPNGKENVFKATMLLLIIQKIDLKKDIFLQSCITIQNFRNLNYVARLLLPHQDYSIGEASGGIKFM